MSRNHLTAAELYEAVWRMPLKALAHQLQLHPQSLGKLCDTHSIPRPSSGYWTLKARGDTPAITPLPDTPYPQRLIDLTPLKANKREKQKLRPFPLPKPTKSVKQYPLLKGLKQSLSAPQFKYDFIMQQQPYNSLEFLRLDVSPEQSKRAISLLHTLVAAFEKRHWPVAVVEKPYQRRRVENQVTINHEAISFRLRERLVQKARTLTAEEKNTKKRGGSVWYEKINVPSGHLQFIIESPLPRGVKSVFEDTSALSLMSQLGHVLVALEQASDYAKKRATERQQEAEERAKKEAVIAAKEKAISDEQQRINSFMAYFSQWQRAEQCRRFIQAAMASKHLSDLPDADVNAFETWAQDIANHLDPFNNSDMMTIVCDSRKTNKDIQHEALSRLKHLQSNLK
jgi:hypothetical protein